MSDPLHDMALAAADVKAASPQRFEDMVSRMFDYEVKCIDDLLSCADNVLVEARSRARTVRQMRIKLQACTITRDQVEQQKRR